MKYLFKKNDGFTLIELAVVIVILGIIIVLTTTLIRSSTDIGGRISSSSEAQTAIANMDERVRMEIVNSREVRLLDLDSSDSSRNSLAKVCNDEFNNKDGHVPFKNPTNKNATDYKNLKGKYGYIVCGDVDISKGVDNNYTGITLIRPELNASGGATGLNSNTIYTLRDTRAVKIFNRFYKSGTSITIRSYAVDKTYKTWDEFEAGAISARNNAIANELDPNKKNDAGEFAYYNTLAMQSVFSQETEIVAENSNVKSKRQDNNVSSLTEGRIIKYYIEE